MKIEHNTGFLFSIYQFRVDKSYHENKKKKITVSARLQFSVDQTLVEIRKEKTVSFPFFFALILSIIFVCVSYHFILDSICIVLNWNLIFIQYRNCISF